MELNGPWEGFDNAGGFLEPQNGAAASPTLSFRLHALLDARNRRKFSPTTKVATRIGLANPDSDARQILIDFAGPKLSADSATNPPVAIVICSTNAQIVANQVVWNPFENPWRAVLKMQPNPTKIHPLNSALHPAANKQGRLKPGYINGPGLS